MLDPRIKFRHLQTFIEVARQTSVGRAADVLKVSQPAVTRTIRELEDILSVRLVERDGRGIRITRVGEVFLRHAGAAIAAARKAVDAVSQVKNAAGPPVRIGALPTVSVRIIPPAVQMFLGSGNGTPIRVVTGENAVLLGQLRGGDLDLVVGRLAAPEQMTGLSFEPLYREVVAFIVRAGHPLLSKAHFSLPDIDTYPILMPPPGSIIRPFVDRFMINNGLSDMKQQVETVSDSFGRAFVRQTDAIWIISRGVVSDEISSGAMTTLPVDTSETIGSVGFSTRADIETGSAATLFMRMVRDAVEEAIPVSARFA